MKNPNPKTSMEWEKLFFDSAIECSDGDEKINPGTAIEITRRLLKANDKKWEKEIKGMRQEVKVKDKVKLDKIDAFEIGLARGFNEALDSLLERKK